MSGDHAMVGVLAKFGVIKFKDSGAILTFPIGKACRSTVMLLMMLMIFHFLIPKIYAAYTSSLIFMTVATIVDNLHF